MSIGKTNDTTKLINHFYDLYMNPSTIKYMDSELRIMDVQYKSYTTFLEELRDILLEDNKVYYEAVQGNIKVVGKIKISNIRMEPPKASNDVIMTPRMAHNTGSTLAFDVYADIRQVIEYQKLSQDSFNSKLSTSKGKSTTTENNVVEEYLIAEDKNSKLLSIPMMIMEGGRTVLTMNERSEYSPIEYGGYFIIKGNVKIAINCTGMVPNRPRISEKDDVFKLYMRSIGDSKQNQFISIRVNTKVENIVTFSSQMLHDINIFVLIRYCGISDKGIHELITNKDRSLYAIVEKCINDSYNLKESDDVKHLAAKSSMYDTRSARNAAAGGTSSFGYNKHTSLLDYMEREFLPHLNTMDLRRKGIYLCYLTKKLLLCVISGSSTRYYDKDSFLGKQFLTIGYYLKDIVKSTLNKIMNKNIEYFKQSIGVSSSSLTNLISKGRTDEIRNLLNTFTTSEITNDIGVLVSIGKFSHYSVIVNCERYSVFLIPHTARKINKTLRQPKQGITKMLDARNFHVSSVGFTDPNETPEHGANAGLTLSMSLVATISCVTDKQERLVFDKINEFYMSVKEGLSVDPISDIDKFVFIIESKLVDFIRADRAHTFYEQLRYEKRKGSFIENDMGIIFDYCEKEIRINTFSGRLTKPLLIFDKTGLSLECENMSSSQVNEFLNLKSYTDVYERFPHIFEVVDIEQFAYSMVCQDMQTLVTNLDKYKHHLNTATTLPTYIGLYSKFSLMEAPGNLIYSLNATSMSFPNMMQGTRVIFGTSQTKQTASFSTGDFKNSMGNGLFMPAPEKPLIVTKAFSYTRIPNIGFGINGIMAIIPFYGDEKDDAVILKQSSVHRGFLTTETSKKYVKQIDVSNETNSEKNCIRIVFNYDKLNDHGYVDIGTVVEKDDVLIKNIVPISKKESTGELITIDNSQEYQHSYPGKVVSHAINHQTNKKEHRMQINSFKPMIAGDKIGTRTAQKGTVSRLVADHLLPYDSDGVRPDIICNPLAIGNRKTSPFWLEALIMECIAERNGELIDFDSFTGTFDDIIKYAKELLGDRLGEKTLYNPITHKKVLSYVIMGGMYYSASKHKVADKAYGRSQGKRNEITRQANGGKSKGGGVKFGEMDRDCVIGHGASNTLLDILSDPYDSLAYMYFCDRCKGPARFNRDVFGYERYLCIHCKTSNISKFCMPYVIHTLNLENMSRGQLIKYNNTHTN